MTVQPDLFGGTTIAGLTARQQAVYDHLAAHPDGVAADEAGAVLHSMKQGRWAHTVDERCDYCQRDGRGYLERLVELGHLRRRRGAGHMLYVPADSDKNSESQLPAGMLRPDEELPY